jgi:hypothetical protein
MLVASVLLATSCIDGGGGSVWDDDESLPDGETDTLIVESSRPDRAEATLGVPVFAAPIGDLYVAGDGSLVSTTVSDGGLQVTRTPVDLPVPNGQKALVLARPDRLGDGRIVVAYNTIDDDAPLTLGAEVLGRSLAVIDGESGAVDENYPAISLPADAGVLRSDVVAAVGPRVSPQRIFVGVGSNSAAPQARGKVVAIDPERWRSGGSAIVSSFETVSAEALGGGVHGEAAISLVETSDGRYEVLVTTGKGATDVTAADYANGVLRLDPQLQFEPGCDTEICGAQGGDSRACLATCSDFFVPRAMEQQDKAHRRVGAACEADGALECLELAAFDGSSAPQRFTTGGTEGLAWLAADGHLYLLPVDDWTHASYRMQVADAFGDAIRASVEAVTPMTTLEVDRAALLIPTYTPGNAPAGISRYLLAGDGSLKLEREWSAPPLDHPSATTRFRTRPSRLTNGALMESGERARLFAPQRYGSERGVDVYMRPSGAVRASSAPVFGQANQADLLVGQVEGTDATQFDAVSVEVSRPYGPSKEGE